MGKENNGAPKKRGRGEPIDKAEKQIYLAFIADQYVRGYSYRTIVRKVEEEFNQSFSLMTISRFVNQLLKEWKEQRITKLDDMKAAELQRIHKLEQTYWDGWERSLNAYTKSSEKNRAHAKTDGDEVTMLPYNSERSTFVEETYGDPRFLAGIQWCIQMRCKILGIEAPIQINGNINTATKHTTVFKTKVRVKPE